MMMQHTRTTDPARPIALMAAWLSLVLIGIVAPHALAQSQPFAVPAFRQADRVAIITIHEPIDRVTAFSIKRRMQMAIDGGAQALVFDIDTPGGEVPAVLEICSMIKASPVPNTVAWINPEAYSGGAIIALACREIVVANEAKMGDALPILISPTGVDVATHGELRKKQVPPVLAEVVDSARIRGWDEFLVQAIVIDKVELWWVEEVVNDGSEPRKMAVNEVEFGLLFPNQQPPRGSPAIVGASSEPLSGLVPGTNADELTPIVPESETGFRPATPALEDLSPALSGETSASTTQDLDMLASVSARPILTSADAGKWRVVRYLTNGSGPIVMSKQELLDYGFGARTINSDSELTMYFGAKETVRIKPTWTEIIVKALSNMWVRMLLIAIFLLAIFIEMVSPGLFVPSVVAGVAILLVMAPAWMLGLAGWWEAIAIFAGIVLILLEIFVIPGFGIFGISGLVLLFGGLVMSFVGASNGTMFPSSPAGQADLTRSVVMVLLAMTTAGGGMFAVGKYFGSLPILNRLVPALSYESGGAEIGFVDAMGASDDLSLLVGMTGAAHTLLRPSGKVEIDGTLYDAKAGLGFVAVGTPVRVVRAESWQIVVEPIEADGTQS